LASWQARVTNFLLRRFVKRRHRGRRDVLHREILVVRRQTERCEKWLTRPLKGTEVRPVREAGVRGEWVVAAGACRDHGILFVHGGAFMIGSPGIYRHLASRLSAAAGCGVFSVDYRLAPEHPFPAGLDDVLAAWDWLGGSRLEPSRLVAAGDSAGGNLALAALMTLRDSGRPLPAALVTMAPWTDLTLSGASVVANDLADPYLPANLLRPVAELYLNDAGADSPQASPLFGSFAGLPPMLVHVGKQELLLDDSLRLVKAATDDGVQVSLKVWDGLPHVFQLFAPFVPEGRQSLLELGQFARAHLQAQAHRELQ
jgi:acetyl esterase/lipase